MDDKNLIKSTVIDINKIDKQNFLQSLINQAMNLGLMTTSQEEQIQIQISHLLSYVLGRYTRLDSSSVKIETAQDTLCSIIYCIDLYLANLNNADMALETINTIKLSKIYKNGLELVKKDISVGKKLFKQVKNNRIAVDILAYNDTLDYAN